VEINCVELEQNQIKYTFAINALADPLTNFPNKKDNDIPTLNDVN
jgi:hypothetical protein